MMTQQVLNRHTVIRYYPRYTQVKYYRSRKLYPHKQKLTGWTERSFHMSLLAGIVFITLVMGGMRNFRIERVKVETKVLAQEISTPSTTRTPVPPVTPEPTPQPPAKGWEGFKEKIKRIAYIYDYPVKVAMAQAALESNRGNSKIAIDKKNFFGLHAFDSDPYFYAWTFENEEQSIIKYMQTIQERFPQAYANRNNPDKMIELIKSGGYATDPNYVQKIKQQPEWKE